MIGDGGKVGGPPGVPLPVSQDSPGAKPATDKSEAQTPKAPDSFVKTEARPQVDQGPKNPGPVPLGREGSTPADVLRLARDNPAAARQLVATLTAQLGVILSNIEQALAIVRQMLEKLAKERFAREALKAAAEELRKKRAGIAALKRKMWMATRKTALLQQVAGKLGDPRLDEEIDRILSHHSRLQTDWAKRHHLLSVGSSLYGDRDETPDHLKAVVNAQVHAGPFAEEAAQLLSEISPRVVIAELIARTLDGSVRDETRANIAAKRGEYGRSMQSCALLSELLDGSMSEDPFGED